MHPRLIPQRELNAIPDSDLVVDLAEVVSDNIRADPKFLGDFVVVQPVARQNSNCTSKVILKGVSPTEIGWVGGHGC